MMAIYLKGQTQLAAEVESTEVVRAEHHVRATLGHELTDLGYLPVVAITGSLD